METRYVLLVAIFLLLVVVGCSGNDSKGKGDEKIDLDPKIERGDSKSMPDSIGDNGRDQSDGSEKGVDTDASKNFVEDGKQSSGEAKGNKDGGKDQIDGSKGGADIDASKSDAKQQSSSNEGENAVKDGKQLSGEAKGNTDSGTDNGGDQIDGSKGGADNVDQHSGSNEGKNVVPDGKQSSGEEKGNTDSGKDNTGDQTDESKGGADNGASKRNVNQESGSNEGKNVGKDGKQSSGEAKGNTNGGKDHGGDQIDGSEGGADNDASRGNVDQKSSSNEGKNPLEDGKEPAKSRNDKGGDQIDGSEKGSKKESEGEDIIQGSVQPPPPLKRAECDSSNMCTNETFAACLQVAGNDSPNILLLIQNKGKGPLNLKISAPSFVQLEEKDVELEEKQDKKVKISIEGSGTGSLIVLKDGTRECRIDLKDLIPQSSAESYVIFLSLTPRTAFMFAAAILILASCWMSKSFRWRQLAGSGSKYQRLDVGLPVSTKARREPEVDDGWDNSWGDNWDDEEAPVTPSMPKTPSVSAKGLASRRLSKEAWKD